MLEGKMARNESIKEYYLADGRVVTLTLRDTLAPEDPYLVLCRAAAYTIRTGSNPMTQRVDRTIRDHLIKTNISI
jgi:DNA helicase TIP49 (TBP-interacting protein)